MLKWLTRLDAIVQFKPGGGGIVAALGIAPPLAVFERWEVVKRLVEVVQQFGLHDFLSTRYPCRSKRKSSSGVGSLGFIVFL